ncbi:AfsR/SARP family transcriptional regulator [Amycolatopsis sp. WGS_07]|uniref:AfsR/SARP family transcriptional regulator n=1 Tax=Amycolatopsis sp. WGS_07 TaxID=3076764 RepID=UPI003872B885
MEIQFRLLGEIEVRVGGQPIDVGHDRQRCVLAVLLAEAGRPVPVGQVVDRVWGGHRLPGRPLKTVQTYVSLLRRALAPAAVSITHQPAGYRIGVDEQTVDLNRFRNLIDQAHAAEDEKSAALLEQALALWRGVPFAALDTPWINATRAVLAKQRHAAQLDLTDLRLRRGQHAALVPELAARAAEHPWDERVAGQLMLALYRSGCQNEALLHYRRIRRRLAGELGIDPGPALRELQRRILAADPALAAPATAATSRSVRVVVPRQLPAPPRLFTGRAEALARLDTTLRRQGEPLRTIVISGMGGMGKTWLALHWAHQHLDHFPDGQLYVDLRGFSPAQGPVPTETAVRGFLAALGVSPAAIPPEPEAQAGLYRSLVAGKRMLVVLDNAADSAHVLDLLPGTGGCVTLVISRRRLTGLMTTHRADPLDLDALPDGEAAELLAALVGRDRTAAEPEALLELIACCAGLPLALGVVAVRAAAHPRFPLAALADELREASTRLDALDSGELTTRVRTVLSWSDRTLDPATAAVFALTGLAPGPEIGLPAAANLTGLATDRVRAVFRELENAYLVQQCAPGRYRMHDLIRLYAGEQARRQPEAGRSAALRRLVDYYLHTAHIADNLLEPSQTVELDPPGDGCRPCRLPDIPAALAWFDKEHPSLVAAQRLAADNDWHAPAWQLAWVLDNFLLARGRLHDHVHTWRIGLAAAQRLKDPAAQALARQRLGLACSRAGLHAEALTHLRCALSIARRTRDRRDLAHTHRFLAKAWGEIGDNHQALSHSTIALRLFRLSGSPVWEAIGLNQAGWFHARCDEPDRARAYCERANLLFTQHRDREGQMVTLHSLGYIAHRDGRDAQAIDHYQQAIALCRDIGRTYTEADILEHLGHAYAALGRHGDAHRIWDQALDLYRTQHRVAPAHRLEKHLAACTGNIRSDPGRRE